MQLTGDRFTSETAQLGNDISTLPNFPAEIRAPAGTLPGVSSFQVHFADFDILTPGDSPNVLVAMNPAALKANLGDVPRGAEIIVNTDEFTPRNLTKVGYARNPLEDGSLDGYTLHPVALTSMTVRALESFDISKKDAERAKNMFALGLLSWMYNRPTESTITFLQRKFAKAPQIAAANIAAFKAGWNFGETTEDFAVRYEVKPARMKPGSYRNVTGNTALALGLVAAGVRSGLPVVLGAYPITPASVILLSDGYIANGSEPWQLPTVSELPDLRVEFANKANGPNGEFLPYLRDPITLARPWAIPGTPGLEHRIGGLEKADKTGDISYDPANHDFMVRTRAARIEAIEVPPVEVDDPDGTAQVLVLGWGSTYGPIGAACRALRQRGLSIAQAHLRHLAPMPRNLGDVLRSYDHVVIPEMNLGQLAHVIRARYLVDAIPYNQVRGLPFTAAELETMLEEVVKNG